VTRTESEAMTRPSETRALTLRYFAWVREKTGISEETLQLPLNVETVSDLVAFLRRRGPQFEAAFASPQSVRAALDRVHAKPEARIGDAREIAFFPPVTGG
jgi:sulfur-carrier protein